MCCDTTLPGCYMLTTLIGSERRRCEEDEKDGGREEKLGQRVKTKLQTELELKPGSAETEGCGIKG